MCACVYVWVFVLWRYTFNWLVFGQEWFILFDVSDISTDGVDSMRKQYLESIYRNVFGQKCSLILQNVMWMPFGYVQNHYLYVHEHYYILKLSAIVCYMLCNILAHTLTVMFMKMNSQFVVLLTKAWGTPMV